MAERTAIAVDLAKSVFEIAVSSRPGRVAERHRLSRSQLMRYFGQRSAATVLLEACGSAHFWAREIERCGHRVVLLPPQHARRYRPRNKTDRADAKALLEAFLNEEIRPVPVKTPEQQQLAALHRLRSAWLGTRTARMNNLRGLLREQGVTIPVGARHVVPRAFELAGDVESVLSDALRFALLELAREIRDLERRLDELEKRLAALARESEHVLRLQTIPGIGLITATALAGFVGDLRRFPSGRRFASYLGLTPRERSSGAVRRLGAISSGAQNEATRRRPLLGAPSRRACRPQQGHRRSRQQARPVRLGRCLAREELHAKTNRGLKRRCSERRRTPAGDCCEMQTMTIR